MPMPLISSIFSRRQRAAKGSSQSLRRLEAAADSGQLLALAPQEGEERVKVPAAGGLSLAPYLGKTRGSTIYNSVTNTTDLALGAHARSGSTLNDTIKRLVRISPDLSAAVESKILSALPRASTVVAKDMTGRIDVAGTELLAMLLQRWNYGSSDYTRFSKGADLRSLIASLLLDSYRYGAMMAELVLTKQRMPWYVKAVSMVRVSWVDDSPYTYPLYTVGTQKIPLNYPTVFYSTTMQDADSAYADSPLQAAIQACLWDTEFVDTLRKAAVKNMLQRLVVTINSEKFMQSLPQEVQSDAARVNELQLAMIDDVEEVLAGLSPEDSLVLFDTMTADTVADANRSEDKTINILHDIINGKISTGAKILPSIIGRGQSSNAASVESLLFLKAIAAMQAEVNILISRVLTTSLRLFSNRSTAVFQMEEVNLRPELELESFRAIKQSRILEQLSLGQLDDVEACVLLTGGPPPAGYKPVSGTMFKVSSPNAGSGNDYSNTSVDTTSGKTDSTQSQKTSEAETKGVKSK